MSRAPVTEIAAAEQSDVVTAANQFFSEKETIRSLPP
jgi:hypothetical protein